MLTFREMTMEDLEEVLRIEEENFSTPWTANSFFSFFIRNDTYFACVFEGEELAGYAGLMLIAPEAELVNIAVKKSCQNKGIGRALLDHVLAEAADRGITDMFLEVRISNTTARKLYDKAGFTFLAIRKDYYEDPIEDALLMKREIRP